MAAWGRPQPFAFSILVHGLVLGWVATGPGRRGEEPKSLYEQVIAPNARKIVWYSFREKLPPVSPADGQGSREPVRPRLRAPQEMASRSSGPAARQMIWEPAPKLRLEQEIRSPNLIAFEPPRVAPPERPKPKLFVPPAQREPAPPPVSAIAAPPRLQIAAARPAIPMPAAAPQLPSKPQPRRFIPPKLAAPVVRPAAALPAAPQVQIPADLQSAPVLSDSAASRLPARPAPRKFVAPERSAGSASARPGAALEEAPTLSASTALPSNPALAIVGVDPMTRDVPLPAGAREGQFTAGPEPRDRGSDGGPASNARLYVPGLTVRGGKDAEPALVASIRSPTSRGNLMAAVRSTPASGLQPDAGNLRPAEPPDPSFAGRLVYMLAVQMPNVTSYSGSWTLWFAEREQKPGSGSAMQPPVPVRKVDPKYLPSAVADRVEGSVRFSAVIRSTGRVDSVVLLKHLDDRLDRSAEEALRKWEFQPAVRNGAPVEVDAIFEIPFRLAPLPQRR